MTETKKGLRIIAGVLLLILACLTLATSLVSMLRIVRTDPAMIRYYWHSFVSGILSIVAAILILARKFTGAGIVRCLIFAVSVAAQIINIVPVLQNGMPGMQSLASDMPELLFRLAGVVPVALLIVGLFLHNRTSKPLLIVSAILSLALSIGRQILSFVPILKQFASSDVIYDIGLTIGFSLSVAIVTTVAWILLGVYFGKQTSKAA